MYERFNDRARRVMELANQEAQRFNHEYIGTEHILLGLVKEGTGVATKVLGNLGLDLRKIRLEVEKLMQSGPEMITMGRLPQTPRAKKAIEYSMESARDLNHNYIGTEHILLGLLREYEGVASQVLMNLGLKLEDVREEVLQLLGSDTVELEVCTTKDEDKVVPPFHDPDAVLNGLLADAGYVQGDSQALLRELTHKDADLRKIMVFFLTLLRGRENVSESRRVLVDLLITAREPENRLPDLLNILSEDGWVRTAVSDVLVSYFAREKGEVAAVVVQEPKASC